MPSCHLPLAGAILSILASPAHCKAISRVWGNWWKVQDMAGGRSKATFLTFCKWCSTLKLPWQAPPQKKKLLFQAAFQAPGSVKYRMTKQWILIDKNRTLIHFWRFNFTTKSVNVFMDTHLWSPLLCYQFQACWNFVFISHPWRGELHSELHTNCASLIGKHFYEIVIKHWRIHY